MNQLERILQRQPHIDEAEIQAVRARAIARLSAFSDQRAGADVTQDDEVSTASGGSETEAVAAIDIGPIIGSDTAPSAAEREIDIVVVDHAEPIVLPLDGLWASPDDGRIDVAPPSASIIGGTTVGDDSEIGDGSERPPATPLRSRSKGPATTRSTGRSQVERRTTKPRVMSTAYCPYCALPLDPPPTADRRCTRCRQRIVVRRVDGGSLVHLTEAAVVVFEAERERAANIARWKIERRKWLDLALAAGASVHRVERLARSAASMEAVRAARAFFEATVDHAVEEALRRDHWEEAARYRREQASALRRLAGRQLPPSDETLGLYRAAAGIELRGIAKMARTAAIVGSRCCETCRVDEGTVRRIAAELRSSRLPHRGCPNGLCRCRWDLSAHDVRMVERYLVRTGGQRTDAKAPVVGTDPEPVLESPPS